MLENIKKRYLKGYITDEQLDKYVELKVITKKDAKEIRASRG